jgi:predicted RecB family nuclease
MNTPITPYDLQQMLSRLERNKVRQPPDTEQLAALAKAPPEKNLHDRILAECAARHWLVIHSRMDVPSTVGVGTPDFVILTQGARTLLVEAKAGKRNPTAEQLAWLAWAAKLGFRGAIVRSLDEFLKFAEGE